MITTQTIGKSDFMRYTKVQAAVMNDEEVYASSETGGRLLSVKVSEGQYVKRGQLIATVDLKSLSDQRAELETTMSLPKMSTIDRKGCGIKILVPRSNTFRPKTIMRDWKNPW